MPQPSSTTINNGQRKIHNHSRTYENGRKNTQQFAIDGDVFETDEEYVADEDDGDDFVNNRAYSDDVLEDDRGENINYDRNDTNHHHPQSSSLSMTSKKMMINDNDEEGNRGKQRSQQPQQQQCRQRRKKRRPPLKNMGIVQLTFAYLFEQIKRRKIRDKTLYVITVSYLEVYNEQVESKINLFPL